MKSSFQLDNNGRLMIILTTETQQDQAVATIAKAMQGGRMTISVTGAVADIPSYIAIEVDFGPQTPKR
jgi:hypothetical protein